VAVLITAPPEQALEIAQEIASRASRNGAARLQVCDLAAGDDVVAALIENRLKAGANEDNRTLVLQEVHLLSEIEQETVMKMFDARLTRPISHSPRIIATSSVSLYERVSDGVFDARLFHRLNVIHIIVPTNGM
jgi:transcriptional regulator of acetoin/glycerol metabolism